MCGRIICRKVPQGKRSFCAVEAVKEIERKIPNTRFVRLRKVSDDIKFAEFCSGLGVRIQFIGDACVVFPERCEFDAALWDTIGVGPFDSETKKPSFFSGLKRLLFGWLQNKRGTRAPHL